MLILFLRIQIVQKVNVLSLIGFNFYFSGGSTEIRKQRYEYKAV